MNLSQITVAGMRINYQTVGQGSDVLFIHGWVSSWRMWARSMSRLAASGYRATAIDLPGFGESGQPADGWYSLDNYTATLLAVCEQLKFQRPALVGHSMGATIALDLALNMDTSAVLAVAPVITGELAFSVHLLLTSSAARQLFSWLRQQKFFSALGSLRPPTSPVLARNPVRRRNQQDLRRTTLSAVMGGLRTVVGAHLEDYLETITAPTLILVGGHDLTVSPSQGKLAALRIPNSRLVEWPDVGHSMTDDRPDEFDQLLIDHLKHAATSIGRATNVVSNRFLVENIIAA